MLIVLFPNSYWNGLLFFSFSNCPSFLAAALARATSDEVLQSDLSAHYIPKETDGTEGTVGKYLSTSLVWKYENLAMCNDPQKMSTKYSIILCLPLVDFMVVAREKKMQKNSFFKLINKGGKKRKKYRYILKIWEGNWNKSWS